MPKALFIFGTRPEAIKLAPLIRVFEESGMFSVMTCVTAQHREMLDQELKFFNILPDFDLNLMQPNQSLFQVTANAIIKLEKVFEEAHPDLVFVQGDTTSVFAGALAAFYKKILVAHVEAGLRTYDKYSPFPEEMNRLLTSRLSDFHFAHTMQAKQNLNREGINQHIYVVGNTVIDALKLGLSIINHDDRHYQNYFSFLDSHKKMILITCHRREIFGTQFIDICQAFNTLANNNPDVEMVYPVHLNPNIKEVAHQLLTAPNIKLIEPVGYPYFIWLMNKCHLVLTDSGGIQEEAPALGKPVLVLRNVTERMEGIEAGTAKLTGTKTENIVRDTQNLLDDPIACQRMAKAINPYGDGNASRKIHDILEAIF
ncbi:MAG: UDP-N-acetylglucosamine 2-epimerase (non-hydrolyzing) [Bacteroidetes bacterium]|nr:UDP-N-acetylglucosamine 2-epimerase (non-hydrolyzing) [Bacteroidota bacterium]